MTKHNDELSNILDELFAKEEVKYVKFWQPRVITYSCCTYNYACFND